MFLGHSIGIFVCFAGYRHSSPHNTANIWKHCICVAMLCSRAYIFYLQRSRHLQIFAAVCSVPTESRIFAAGIHLNSKLVKRAQTPQTFTLFIRTDGKYLRCLHGVCAFTSMVLACKRKSPSEKEARLNRWGRFSPASFLFFYIVLKDENRWFRNCGAILPLWNLGRKQPKGQICLNLCNWISSIRFDCRPLCIYYHRYPTKSLISLLLHPSPAMSVKLASANSCCKYYRYCRIYFH